MPEIKIKHVASFSSEDKVHKAENMLKSETYRKWKCATPGEKNASIVLQFEKATKIHSIDIGNECSAFVEVLVGRSSDSVNEYQVLLVASSFMSPMESRDKNHTNRVRMFDNDKLAQNLKVEKWDCVQVVCTQPFNKNITYGLSFIKFHSPPDKHVEKQPEPETRTAATKLGAFLMKYEEDDDIESSLSVAKSWLKNKTSTDTSRLSKGSSQEDEPSYAAAVLASSSQSKSETSGLSEYERKIQKNKREHQSLMKALKIEEAKKDFTESVKELKGSLNTEKRPSSIQLGLRERNKRLNVRKVNPLKRTLDSDEESLGTPSKKEFAQNALQKASTSNNSNKVAKVEKKRPFNTIMNEVVFALSGFVNPLRGEIRDKALEMGAKYKGDWDRNCTHLVCAFTNTPKYVQVRGADGRIVTKEWITDCYRKKALLPWRSYMLGKYSKSSSEEESGSEEEVTVSPTVKKGNHSKDQSTVVKRRARIISSDSDSAEETPIPSRQQKSKPKPLFGYDTLNEEENFTTVQEPTPSEPAKADSETEDEGALQDYMAATDVEPDSGGDTEDEIRKVEEQARKKKKSARTEQNALSEEEDSPSLLSVEPDTTDLPLPELPNLFKKRHFYLYGEFSSKRRHDLQRFITAYNGMIEDYMGDSIKYVVTEAGWDKNFEDALEENEDLIFVKPEWIFKCHEAQKLVPYQAYIVIPS